MNAYRNRFNHSFAGAARPALALVSAVALFAGSLAGVPAAQQKAPSRRLNEDQRILHVLNRLGFGARPGDVERVKALGLERYIEQQLNPERIPDVIADAKLRNLNTLAMTTAELYAKYPPPGALLRQLERRGELPPELATLRENRAKGDAAAPEGKAKSVEDKAAPATDVRKENNAAVDERNSDYRRAIRDYYLKHDLQLPQRITAELQASRILRAVYSERQLQEVMVDFWTNHFNVFAGKGAGRWLLISYDRDTIRPHALGKFRDMLQATAQSPAMLFYLDNFQSVSPNASTGLRLGQRPQGQRHPLFDLLMGGRAGGRVPVANPNEGQQRRQRRGINENYARELMELHTLGVDGGYTQKDVQEVARCFTGWTIFNPRGFRNMALGERNSDAGAFHFNPRLHDDGEKTVLGHRIPAGGGIQDGLMVIGILAKHPSTANFIATKLSRRFVMDDPPPALVERVAAAFTRSDGDIRETLRAIFSSPEFNSPAAYRAKIKTPFELAVSAIRTLGGETNGGPAIHQWIAKMGEPLYGYQAPTGYPDTAEDWVNTGSLLERLNFGLALASNRIPGTRVDLARFNPDSAKNSSAGMTRLMKRFLDVIVQGDVSSQTKATLLKQLAEQAASPTATAEQSEAADAWAGTRRARGNTARVGLRVLNNPEVFKLVGLILGSPEFQRQ